MKCKNPCIKSKGPMCWPCWAARVDGISRDEAVARIGADMDAVARVLDVYGKPYSGPATTVGVLMP